MPEFSQPVQNTITVTVTRTIWRGLDDWKAKRRIYMRQFMREYRKRQRSAA